MEINIIEVKKIWTDIENELSNQNDGKKIEEMLFPPATKNTIEELERTIGMTLPAEYKLSLNVHEGTEYWVWLWDAVSLPAILQVVDDWKSNIETASNQNNKNRKLTALGPVRDCLFDTSWIPVANDNGIPICIDLNPEKNGYVGQIIYVDWEDGTVKVIANNFIGFLQDGLGKMQHH